jgi:serine/threonine protein kinase
MAERTGEVNVDVTVVRERGELRALLDCKGGAFAGSGGFGAVRSCAVPGRLRETRFAVKTFDWDSPARAEKAALQEARMNAIVSRRLGPLSREVTLILAARSPISSVTVYKTPRGKKRYVVYATCRGRRAVDLFELAREARLTEGDAVWIAADLSLKVAALHDRGVYHNDIKRENALACLRESDGDAFVRLIDFGAASTDRFPALPPGGTFFAFTAEVRSLLTSVLGLGEGDWSQLAALEFSASGKRYIRDSAARDCVAYAFLACELVGGLVGPGHALCRALKRLLLALPRGVVPGDLRRVAAVVPPRTSRRLSAPRHARR